MNKGIIMKAVGGLYFVKTPAGISECKARGVFRIQNISPCAGDIVIISDDNVITDIEPRRNVIIRPPLANLDVLIFVVSTCEPSPNYEVIDKFIAVSEYKGIEPVIAITKTDLEKSSEIKEIYEKAGIQVVVIDYRNDNCCDEIRSIISGKLCAFTGNSGVGKSTLLNKLDPTLDLETNAISKKLGRGKHTTRQVELYETAGGYIADTPGFSTFETNRYDIIKKEDLDKCFREFNDYLGKCKFQDCSHTRENNCAVKDAVEAGKIPKSRYMCYVSMYEQAKNIKSWENE